MEPTRRSFLGAAVATAAFGPAFWRAAYGDPAVPGPGRYGPLQQADANGRLYVSSQRAPAPAGHRGVTYEITGPFRT